MTRTPLAFIVFTVGFTGCNTATPDPVSEEPDRLSGFYRVETVTCDGQVVPITVTANVTFDQSRYVEEWTFPDDTCEVSLEGTVAATSTVVTLEDVVVRCSDTCSDERCDPTPCPIDQVYDYTVDEDGLLLSFAQEGSEHACGPCGDGTPTTYLLVNP